jgi:branched-chain amino acid aminotransferase
MYNAYRELTDMPVVVFLNGQFVSKEDAKVSIFDHGYLFGDGIFETLRAYGGSIFRLRQHLDRLWRSAQYFHLSIPCSKDELGELSRKALNQSGLQDAYLRITLSRGIGERGIDPDACKSPTVSVIVKDLSRYPAEYYQKGADTKILSVRKIADDALSNQVKGCNYQNNILGKIELNQAGMIEGFLLNTRGFVAEGTVSNIFVIARGVLRTPSVSSGCLEGITRNAVMEIAREQYGIPVEEKELTRYDLYTADECFMTNTIMEIMPVRSVDGRQIGGSIPGGMTQLLTRGFQELIKQERDNG